MELLTTNAMAQILGVSPKSLYRWVHLRKVPFIKLERHIRFQPDKVIEHFRVQTESNAPSCFQSDLLLQGAPVGRKSLCSLKISEKKTVRSYPEKG